MILYKKQRYADYGIPLFLYILDNLQIKFLFSLLEYKILLFTHLKLQRASLHYHVVGDVQFIVRLSVDLDRFYDAVLF